MSLKPQRGELWINSLVGRNPSSPERPRVTMQMSDWSCYSEANLGLAAAKGNSRGWDVL